MSTLRVSEIRNASSATGGLDIAADGSVSGALPSPNRNLLYNGAMQVAQRGTSTTGITTAGYYTADRWQASIVSLGTWTQSVENDAPTGSGFRKSLRMLCTTADAAPASGDYAMLLQTLEGQDLQRVSKGTASAQQLTLSFWVKSNVTGTYVVSLYDADNNRLVGRSYSVSASATWERKALTFAADTTGAFDNNNGGSLQIYWGLASGSARTSGTLPAAWSTYADANFLAGQTNLAAATNNYWQITGVQLEVGATATPFEFKSYGQELRECQRYYWRSGAADGFNAQAFTPHAQGWITSATEATILLTPTVAVRTVTGGSLETSNVAIADSSNNFFTPSAYTVNSNSSNGGPIPVIATIAGATANRPARILNNNNTAGFLAWNAEL